MADLTEDEAALAAAQAQLDADKAAVESDEDSVVLRVTSPFYLDRFVGSRLSVDRNGVRCSLADAEATVTEAAGSGATLTIGS